MAYFFALFFALPGLMTWKNMVSGLPIDFPRTLYFSIHSAGQETRDHLLRGLKTSKSIGKFDYAFPSSALASIASESPSPIRLNAVTVINIASPGKTASHHACGASLADDSNFPQLSVSIGSPIPRNESEDSVSIAAAIPKLMVINTGGNAFGKA